MDIRNRRRISSATSAGTTLRAARPVATVLSYTARFPCARMIGSPTRSDSSRSPELNAAGPEQSRISPATCAPDSTAPRATRPPNECPSSTTGPPGGQIAR